jgi:hypothetical protein
MLPNLRVIPRRLGITRKRWNVKRKQSGGQDMSWISRIYSWLLRRSLAEGAKRTQASLSGSLVHKNGYRDPGARVGVTHSSFREMTDIRIILKSL